MQRRGPTRRTHEVPTRVSSTTSEEESIDDAYSKQLEVIQELGGTSIETPAEEVKGKIEESKPVSMSWADTTKMFFSGELPIITTRLLMLISIGWFGFIGWLFIQDNANNKLDTFQGLIQFSTKAGYLTILGLIVAILIFVFSKVENRSRK